MGAGRAHSTEREEMLFAEWTKRCEARFVCDGVIGDYGDWCLQKPKILFLAKEAHDNKGVLEDVGYDLRVLLRRWNEYTHKISPILPRNCGYWAFALERWWNDHSEFCDQAPTNLAARNAAFQRAALVNLKKTAGGNSAEPNQIAVFAANIGN